MLKREWNEIGPAKWKIPFHSTYENFGKSNRTFWSNGTRPTCVLLVKNLDLSLITDGIRQERYIGIITVFVDTRLSKTKHPRKRFQNFRQSYMLSTDRIEIHQSQPASMTKRRSEGHTNGCDWWISIRSVDNTQDCLVIRRWHRRHSR